MSTLSRLIIYAKVGCGWGVIGFLIGYFNPGSSLLWGGALISPLIGVIIGFSFELIDRRGKTARIFLALISLYLAVVLFGLGMGCADLCRDIAGRRSLAVIMQGPSAAVWYITFAGWVLILWPLTYATHTYLGRWRQRLRSHEAGITEPGC